MTDLVKVLLLRVTLHDEVVGYLIGYDNGRNIFKFDDSFCNNHYRSTFSFFTHRLAPKSREYMQRVVNRNWYLDPIFSNLLPEGAYREFISQSMKVDINNEFMILSQLGKDLPGAIVVQPILPEEIPLSVSKVIRENGKTDVKFVQIKPSNIGNKFSLPGMQMKFSMAEQNGRYRVAPSGELGKWIVKTPSAVHKDVPLNEYTAMKLAEIVGVNVPEIKLVELAKLDDLPTIKLPNEVFAYAIKRFDRSGENRVHTEDFAQILRVHPYKKYDTANYEQLAKLIYQFSENGLEDIQQFARRLLVNILLANGDAHIKNWSLYYPDRVRPRLSPAYDILSTGVYMKGQRMCALNMAKNKDWYEVTLAHFEQWSKRVEIPWKAIKVPLLDVMEKARTLWPKAINDLPMNDSHKVDLIEHWARLKPDFRIKS